jgi:succinate semialdehyde reductase
MWKVMMPRKIVFGENAARDFQYPENALVLTTTTPDIYGKWLSYMGIKNYEL